MRIVILGAGRRGLRLAKHLIEEKKNVTFIDSDPNRCNQAVAKLDCLAINGSGTNPDKLAEAGCEQADIFIALSNSDEVNLVSCAIVSSQFKAPRTVAAIRSMSYTGTELTVPLLGIDYIVNPFEETSKLIYDVVQSGFYLNSYTFPHTPFVLCTIPVTQSSSIKGLSLMQIRSKLHTEFILAGIQRGDETILPSGYTTVQNGDTLAVISDKEKMANLLPEFDAKLSKPKNICIIGAGRIARFLLYRFTPSERRHITVIDNTPEHCEHFAQEFPEILILRGDITEESIWEDEQLSSYDLMIALTDKDELNIITSTYAKRMGAAHTIALVKSNPNYAVLARHLDIDTVISTTEVTVDTLLRYVRGENITSIHSIFEGSIEVSEYRLLPGSHLIGVQLKDIPLKGKAIITGVTDKNGKSFLAGGSYTFAEDDVVLVAIPHNNVDFAQGLFS
ncbi:MAG: Trk system potassium transporter TrkA [Sphaerochaetaceae bacterium]